MRSLKIINENVRDETAVRAIYTARATQTRPKVNKFLFKDESFLY